MELSSSTPHSALPRPAGAAPAPHVAITIASAGPGAGARETQDASAVCPPERAHRFTTRLAIPPSQRMVPMYPSQAVRQILAHPTRWTGNRGDTLISVFLGLVAGGITAAVLGAQYSSFGVAKHSPGVSLGVGALVLAGVAAIPTLWRLVLPCPWTNTCCLVCCDETAPRNNGAMSQGL
jgi:hypothetical protein